MEDEESRSSIGSPTHLVSRTSRRVTDRHSRRNGVDNTHTQRHRRDGIATRATVGGRDVSPTRRGSKIGIYSCLVVVHVLLAVLATNGHQVVLLFMIRGSDNPVSCRQDSPVCVLLGHARASRRKRHVEVVLSPDTRRLAHHRYHHLPALCVQRCQHYAECCQVVRRQTN
jgi:hypothetical protein